MNEKQLFRSTWTKWGIILGVAGLVFNVVLGFLGLFGNRTIGWLSLILNIGVIVAAFAAYKQENQGYLKFGRAIGLSAMIGLIGGVIGGVLLVGYMLLDAGMMDQMLDNQVEQSMEVLEKRGIEMDEATLREQMEAGPTKMITYGALLIFGPIMSVIASVLIGLVAGAVMKNDPPADYNSPMHDMGDS